MKSLLLVAAICFLAAQAGAATTRNDDSCDVAVLPAATLLLPYFEVDLENQSGETTLFTITNTRNLDSIARVTLWTDRSFPVITFSVYLTGYDVQAINLFDVLVRGIIAPDLGTGTDLTKRGSYSDPNQAIDLTGCTRLPGPLDPLYLTRMQSAFTTGSVPSMGSLPGCTTAGGVHDNAVGYATIDLVRTCSEHFPTDPRYWTEDIAFENVLLGDYQQLDGVNNFAQGNSMVHIRAIPEGGTIAERRAQPAAFDAGFPRTFYSRHQTAAAPRFDGRQPLPSTFAARWIEGGTVSFQTSLKIWREGPAEGAASCGAFGDASIPRVTEIVRFDEAENAAANLPSFPGLPIFPQGVLLPQTSRTSLSSSEYYPQLANSQVAGWVYLNLDSCGAFGDSQDCASRPPRQAWVVTSMRAEGRYSVDADAAALGNGCSPSAAVSEVTVGAGIIGPAPNGNN